ncbi:MAG: riboflavin synthase [Gomphosphaeria aponina SAG 52.96 = DSM 107014]|uniref:Riboflavin synthase n=1 Tax=Gomphosphaeria aponina SAG 52.96 = DSM 107014 TaxID=1521640 RepID=A0A941GRL2_9CHRO|nr:riboflavin synthase [Gomphosphaeria aponina SAG 52.96 = DSM 107014]
MFTGLVHSLGSIRPVGQHRFALSLLKESSKAVLFDLAIGDSVAVDGVCLTVEEILPDGFVATASPETLERTTLGKPSTSYVNLEASLRMGSKIGGHFVTGHIDGIGCLIESVAAQKAWEMTFGVPPSLSEQWERHIAPYLIPKGSIAVNGISLTVAECDPDCTWFKAAVIPHTYTETNLSSLTIGNWVNIESDILGKYVNKLLCHRLSQTNAQEDISLDFLAEHGYLSS